MLNAMNTRRAVVQYLQSLKAAGMTHLPKVDLPKQQPAAGAVKRTVSPGDSSTSPGNVRSGAVSGGRASSSGTESSAGRGRRPDAATGNSTGESVRTPGLFHAASDLQPDLATRPPQLQETSEIMSRTLKTVAERTEALCALSKVVAKCRRCTELAAGRTQTVFGVGRPDARIMFLGEAPGADEDACGEPFVGKAGQLLDRIVAACQLKREDIYICNILRCRPPGNRNPLPQEAANCREFLDAQIKIVRPEFIICWGAVAAQNLLGVKQPIGKLRGQFMDYQGARVLCTYHPAYMLRNPSAKVPVWEDMKFFMRELGVELK